MSRAWKNIIPRQVKTHTCTSRSQDGLTRFRVPHTDHRTGREQCIAEINATGDACRPDTEPWRDQESGSEAGSDCEDCKRQ